MEAWKKLGGGEDKNTWRNERGKKQREKDETITIPGWTV